MTAYGRKSVVKTWFELIMLTFGRETDEEDLFIETSLGFSPTMDKAHKKARRRKLRRVTIPLSAERRWDIHPGNWFIKHFKRGDKGYYIREVDLVHEYGRKSVGRIVSKDWVFPYGARKGGPRKRVLDHPHGGGQGRQPLVLPD